MALSYDKKIEHFLFCFFPIYSFYFPTLRLGSSPLRFEDIICIIFFSLVIINSSKMEKKVFFIGLGCFIGMLSILLASAFFFTIIGGDINFKTVVVGISYIKYLLWFYVIGSYGSLFDNRNLKLTFIKVMKFCFVLQFLIIVFQKFDVLGFASGIPFHFVVKFYSIPNIYSTSLDINALISTHLNFRFRPAGTFGSSTITGVCMFIFGHILYMYTKNIMWKVLSYLSVLICFAKIAIVMAIFVDFIIPMFSGNKRAARNMIMVAPILLLGGYFLIEALGVMHNLMGAVNGTDRGVTHRLDVVNYMINMEVVEFLFGNLGVLPFGYFDSGVLLSIFRFGILFFILEYILLFLMFNYYLKERRQAATFCCFVFFADLTFGSIFNPVFSSVIFLMLLSCSLNFKLMKSRSVAACY